MKLLNFLVTATFFGALMLIGCDTPTTPSPPSSVPPADSVASKEKRDAINAAQNAKRANAIASEIKKGHRRDILRDLGALKSWQVSTERNGKTDEELTKAAMTGVYDKALKEAFEHRGLELKFFIRLPKAIELLRKTRPKPDACDFVCAEPVDFETIQKLLDPGVTVSEDKDPAGRPRKWYNDEDVSFGVIDNQVTVVRVNVASKNLNWQSIGAPK